MRLITILLSAGCLLLTQSAVAGEIKVNWFEPENYTDMKGAHESDKRFQRRTMRQFDKHFEKLAKKLPEGVNLSLKVKDVNLAGDVRYSFNMRREVRLVKSMYWPSMEFEYQLTEKNKLIGKGEVKLKDMSFMMRSAAFSRHKTLRHEKRLFDEWFEEQLEPQLIRSVKQHDAVMAE